MSDPPPTGCPDPLQVSLSVEGREADRWRCRVRIHPCGMAGEVAGATLSVVDEGGAPAGPVVVLPVEGVLTETVSLVASVRGPARLPPGAALRLTVFVGGTTLVWDEPVVRREGFRDFLAGRSVLAPGPFPEGRNLTSEEIDRLAAAFPWLTEADAHADSGSAFEAFQQDLLSSMDLDEEESVTEEILRMLRDT